LLTAGLHRTGYDLDLRQYGDGHHRGGGRLVLSGGAVNAAASRLRAALAAALVQAEAPELALVPPLAR